MAKKIMTLDNLYQFFVAQNKTVSFTAKDTGKPIVVTTDGFFAENESDTPGMQRLEFKVCHTDTNRNGSHISKANMEKAMPTLKYRPVLAYIHELKDGTKDFYAHNMEIVENEDGESEIHYIEKQVGCFTAEDPWLKYDEKNGKTYVHAYAVIPEGYTEAADIIRRKGGTKVSCELVINELSYNAKEKYLDLTDFYFGGCTLLGVDEEGNEIGEGMLGSRADIADFCHQEPVYAYQDKLIETLNKLNVTLESFSNTTKNSEEKGGEKVMNKFEELCAKYNKTAEEVTFEYENLSDEELEVAFKEAFEETEEETEVTVEETVVEEETEEPEVEETEEEEVTEVVVEESIEEDAEPAKFTKTFTVELSHEDVRYALYNLIGVYEEEDNEWYSIRSVYDNYFYMQGWCTNKLYKVGYAVDGENVSLEGERQEMFEIIVSESEKIALEKMREDYAALETQYNELKAFKENYDATELKAKKDAILARTEYAVLADDEAFKELVENAEKYSVDELETKADLIFAKFVKVNGEYSVKNEPNKPSTIAFNFNAKPNKKKTAYGGLFDKDE
jgi:hypothetical protein